MSAFSNFNPTTLQRDKHNAAALAEASRAAYQKAGELAGNLAAWGFERTHLFDLLGTQGWIGGTSKYVVVAFRGTEPSQLTDLIADIDIRLIGGPGGQVHAGFLRALLPVWPELRRKIDEFQQAGDTPTLWFTGHSLGAALATLSVAKLRLEEDKPVHGLYTYGSPRVGDRNFARHFDFDIGTRTFRFVNNNDSVTRVPPREFGYSHVGEFWYLDTHGGVYNDPSEWYVRLDRVRGRLEDILEPGTDGIKDHAMDNYVRILTTEASR